MTATTQGKKTRPALINHLTLFFSVPLCSTGTTAQGVCAVQLRSHSKQRRPEQSKERLFADTTSQPRCHRRSCVTKKKSHGGGAAGVYVYPSFLGHGAMAGAMKSWAQLLLHVHAQSVDSCRVTIRMQSARSLPVCDVYVWR